VVDEDFAKRIGIESLDKLKELLRTNLNQQYTGAARFKLKRALLDALDKAHDFPLPPKMVEAEFDGIWQQVQSDKDAGRLPEEDAKKSEKKLREEYGVTVTVTLVQPTEDEAWMAGFEIKDGDDTIGTIYLDSFTGRWGRLEGDE
jgi:FKBP-type peptidyl-prolyl cis-trans isomerase (trigger factor)